MIEALQVVTRPIVTLMLVASLCWGFHTGKVSAEAFIGIVGSVVTFWFSQRQTAKDAPKDRATDQASNGGAGPSS